MTAKKVIIYTTPTCVYCKLAKDFFSEHNISYQELDVADDEKARDEMLSRSHQLGVPVIDIEGEIFVGFDRDALAKAFGI